MKDDELEQQINSIIAKPNNLNIPDPITENRVPYGYKAHKCPVCGQYCLIRGGGYVKHYVAAHDPSLTRQKAKAIIAAVRKFDRNKNGIANGSKKAQNINN